MKNKGFTLVELLAVIIILGVLASLVTVSVNNILKENKQKLYDIQINNIKEGAKLWADEHFFELPTEENQEIILTLKQLKDNGNVKKDITNPKTNQLFSDDLQVKIIRKQNDYEYILIGG